jgi:hypothetical protein
MQVNEIRGEKDEPLTAIVISMFDYWESLQAVLEELRDEERRGPASVSERSTLE